MWMLTIIAIGAMLMVAFGVASLCLWMILPHPDSPHHWPPRSYPVVDVDMALADERVRATMRDAADLVLPAPRKERSAADAAEPTRRR